MKFKWIFALGIVAWGCNRQDLPAKYLSKDTVVRTAQPLTPKNVAPISTLPDTPAVAIPPVQSKLRYHIIVSSFGASEKASAEKLADRLKAKNFPASLLFSSQRYRVSIEGFPTEAEAGTALDKYKEIMKRQDLWILKTD